MRLLLALGLAAVPAAAQFRTATPAVRPVTPTVPALSLSAPTLSGASNLLKSSGVERAPLPTLPSPHGRLPTVHTPSMVTVNRPGYAQPVDGWLSTVQAPSRVTVNRPGYPQVTAVQDKEKGQETEAVTVREGLERAARTLSPRSAGVTLNLVFDGEVERRTAAEPTSVSEGGALAAPTLLKRMPRETDAQGREVPAPTGVRALVRTHYLGILHDTAFKTFFSAWVTATLAPAEAGLYVSLATGLFTAPYLLLSAWAGRLADRTDKARLINRLKIVEVGLAVSGALALALGSPWGALAVVAALGTRSAVMSPAKYSLLAERVPSDKLGGANGWLELSTFLSLVVGTALGGALASWGAGPLASAAFGAAAVVGWWTSRTLLTTQGPAAPPAPPQAGPAPRMPAKLVRAGLAIAFFWLLSSIIQMNIFQFGAQTLGVGTGMVTGLLTAIGLATGAGALLAGKLSKDKVELGLVPLGAAGVALFLLDLGIFGGGSIVRAFIDLSLLSVSAGFFYIPLNAYLQQESPAAARGRFLGLANLMTFAAILGSAGVYWLLATALALTPAAVFTASAALAVAAAVPTFWFLRAPLREFIAKRLP